MRSRLGFCSYRLHWLSLLCLAALLAACFSGSSPSHSEADPHLLIYNWADEIPQTVLDAFTDEYGIQIDYQTYDSTEEAVASLRNGDVYDVVVLESRLVGSLIEDGLLAEIDFYRVPNFKNVSPSFRNLSFDPGNRYSIPYSWGVVGIIANRNLRPNLPQRWADLWDVRYCGRIGVWSGQTRQMISLTLKSLGYSANSENPVELAEAQERLIKLRPCIHLVDNAVVLQSLGLIVTGQVVVGVGHAYEAVQLRNIGIPADFTIPTEGSLLWSDNFVLPTSSQHPDKAEAFIDFLLRPEISAQIANENSFQIANDAALPLLSPTLAQDDTLYPPIETLRQTEFLLPLSREGERQYALIGEAFLNAVP